MTPFSRYQLTIIYVIPLDKSKNFKFMSEYDDSFLQKCRMVVITNKTEDRNLG